MAGGDEMELILCLCSIGIAVCVSQILHNRREIKKEELMNVKSSWRMPEVFPNRMSDEAPRVPKTIFRKWKEKLKRFIFMFRVSSWEDWY